MTSLRRILTVAAVALFASGLASADFIEDFTTAFPLSGTQATDFTYNLTLPGFNVAGATLKSTTLYFYVNATVQSLTIHNTSSVDENNFEVSYTLNGSQSQTNSLVAADHYGNETLDVFDSGIISLGNSTKPACPEGTPTTSCNSVSYTPPAITDQNTTDGCCSPVGTGAGGVTGVVLDSSNPLAYEGVTSFTITGNTHSLTSFSGGGGNILLTQVTNANMELEVDYDYTIAGGAPEPATMALMGGALLGLGLLGKRLKKK